MAQTRSHIAVHQSTARSAVSNGSRLLCGVDGRSAPARRYRDLVKAFTAELGGEDILTEPLRAMVRQAAAVTVESENLQSAIVRGENVDTEQLVRLSNVLSRLMNSLTVKAKAVRAGRITAKSQSLRERLLAEQRAA